MSERNMPTDPMKSKRLRGYAALWLGVFTSSLSPILVKGGDAPTIVTTFYRMAIAAVFWTFVVLERTIRGKEGLFREVRANPSWLIFPVAAGFCSSFDHGLWSLALNTESVNKASVLNSLSPVWISLVGLLILKENFNKKFWIGLALVIIGMAVTSGKGQSLFSGGFSGGDLLAFCSSFFYAGYFFFTQLGRRRFSVITQTWIYILFCALGLMVFVMKMGHPFTGYSRSAWINFFVLSLISQIGGYFLLTYALGTLPATIVSPSTSLKTVFSTVIAWIFLKEIIPSFQIIGSLIIIAGVILVNLGKEEEKIKN